jgi:glycosyltransferase involved in cell wall biosynthesis
MVTVLMPVWETPLEFLKGAVDSILAQSAGEFEFLILDDGSRSAALGPYLEAKAAADGRIRLVREPHRGLTASLNRGLALASGEWIARQDADDWSEPERLSRQIAFLRRNPDVILCGTNAWMHQHHGRPLWRTRLACAHAEILDAIPQKNPFVHGSVIFLKSAALAAGGYRAEFPCSQDYDLFWRLAQRGSAANLAEPLYHYRFSAGGVSAARAADQWVAQRASQKLAEARQRGEAEEIPRAIEQARREMEQEDGGYLARLKQADHLMLAGEYRHAGKIFMKLLSERWSSPLAWAKLVRLGVFLTAPAAREACFR